MSKRKNVLLIVVDQWRGELLPKLGATALRTPNLDRLCAEGATFRNHFTQAVPCGPGRASLLTGQYLMNHRAVQNTIPLDSRFTNLAHELRRGGYDAALVGYTTTTPDPRTTSPDGSARRGRSSPCRRRAPPGPRPWRSEPISSGPTRRMRWWRGDTTSSADS